jgi:hypothetical protein
VPLNFISENFLFDTLSALSLMIAFYYALTGFACAIYYRHELTKSVKNFLFIGAAPVLGALMLAYLFFRSMVDLANPGASYSGGPFFGLGVPLVIGLGFLLLGVIIEILWRLSGHEGFSDAAGKSSHRRSPKAGYRCRRPPPRHPTGVRGSRAVAPFGRHCYTDLIPVL